MAVKNKIFLPTLISSITYQPVRTLPHIYFYNGLKDCEDYYIQHYPTDSTAFVETSVQNKFPYLDYYDGLEPTTGSNSLLFFNETPPYGVTPTGSLYTQYWDKYVSLLYNPRTRLIKASAIIPLADYFEMELNDIVQWRGNYYHLRAINDYNLKDGTCKLELLGPIIRDAAPTEVFDCTFNFSSSLAGVIPTTTTTTIIGTTTTLAPTTTTTLAPTTTTIAPTTSTTLAPTTSTTTQAGYTIEYLMVGGGGGGSSRHAGGGGAGGFISGSTSVILTNTYPIVVGAGGTGTTGLGVGTNGNNTTFNSLTAHGGGTGGGSGVANGAIGGSGGGALGVDGATGGASSGSQGFAGGNGVSFAGGGGGGASETGFNGAVLDTTTSFGGDGGDGKLWLNGIRYAGGGGGAPMGLPAYTSFVVGIGGEGGGGDSGDATLNTTLNGIPGTPNTGGGGGAGAGRSTNAGNGAAGGSGIVIIRYFGTPVGTGGTITQSGGYTYHTFTSSGTFTPGSNLTTTTTASPTTTTTLAPTTTVAPTTSTTLAPTTTVAPTTTTTIALNQFSNSGYGNTVNGSCSDASINNRTLYSDCSSINVGCTIYTSTGGTLLTGFTFVFIDGAVWNINSSTGVITGYSSIQC